MVDFIIEKFNKIILESTERYGKEAGLPSLNMQVMMKLDDENEVAYGMLQNYQPFKSVTFLQLMNVKIDFRGYSMIVPKFIKDLILSNAEEMGVDAQSLYIVCINNNDKQVINCLYHGNKFIKQLDLKEIL